MQTETSAKTVEVDAGDLDIRRITAKSSIVNRGLELGQNTSEYNSNALMTSLNEPEVQAEEVDQLVKQGTNHEKFLRGYSMKNPKDVKGTGQLQPVQSIRC